MMIDVQSLKFLIRTLNRVVIWRWVCILKYKPIKMVGQISPVHDTACTCTCMIMYSIPLFTKRRVPVSQTYTGTGFVVYDADKQDLSLSLQNYFSRLR